MFKVDQLREFIIKPALHDLVMFCDDAMELLVFTCAVESDGGSYLKQVKGPALGIYQMEPATYNDIWQNYLKGNSSLLLRLLSNFGIHYMPSEDRLIYDLKFATAMSRLFYARVPEPIPNTKDVDALWEYYKRYYNTEGGAAKKVSSLLKYRNFLKG